MPDNTKDNDPKKESSEPLKSPATERWSTTKTLTRWFFGWILGTLAFLLATVRNSEIQDSFPPTWQSLSKISHPSQWHLKVLLFWVAAVGWALLTALRSKFEEDRSKERAKKGAERAAEFSAAAKALAVEVSVIQTQASEIADNLTKANTNLLALDNAVNTLPSAAFRTEYANMSGMFYQALEAGMPRQIRPGQDPAQTVRYLLSILLTLRGIYENNTSARYGGNIMFFRKASSQDPFLDANIMEKVKISCPHKSLRAVELVGALILEETLSTHSRSTNFEVDDCLASVAFGVPQSADLLEEGSPWVLPGAMETFISSADSAKKPIQVITGYFDTQQLADLKDRYNLQDWHLRRLSNYFSSDLGRYVRSFISLPLRRPNLSVFGVLNIHSDSPWTNGNSLERQMNFGMIVMPLVHEVASACLIWGEKSEYPIEDFTVERIRE